MVSIVIPHRRPQRQRRLEAVVAVLALQVLQVPRVKLAQVRRRPLANADLEEQVGGGGMIV